MCERLWSPISRCIPERNKEPQAYQMIFTRKNGQEQLEQMAHGSGRPASQRDRAPLKSDYGKVRGEPTDTSHPPASSLEHHRQSHKQQLKHPKQQTVAAAALAASSKSPKSSPRKHNKKGGSGALEMGIKNMEVVDQDFVVQTVEILKRPGQTLGFYIREGNGIDRQDGVFISRIAPGSVVENNGLLRIGDEIVTVNAVNVTHTSLDDVVILMSIPKRLVLTIRTRRNYPKDLPDNLCVVEEEKPIVVLKHGSRAMAGMAGTSSGLTSGDIQGDKCPDEFILAGTDARAYCSKHSPYTQTPKDDGRRGNKSKMQAPAPPSHHKSGQGDRQYVADDSGDSGLSSENSGYSRGGGGEGSSTQSSQQNSSQYTGLERAVDDLDSMPMDGSHLPELLTDSAITGKRSPKLSPRDGDLVYKSPVSGRRTLVEEVPYPVLDYASDSEIRRYHHQRSHSMTSDPYAGVRYLRQYDLNTIKAFQDEIERTHSRYEQGGYLATTRHKLGKSRSVSPDCYNSDSEVVYSRVRDDRGSLPRQHALARLLDIDDRCNSMPRMDGNTSGSDNSEEIKHWLRKFDTLSYDVGASIPTSQGSYLGGPMPDAIPKEAFTYPNDEYWSWYASKVNPTIMKQDNRGGSGQRRVTRKLSADSLLDYRTYQMEDPYGEMPDARYAALVHTMGRGAKVSLSHTSLSSLAAGPTNKGRLQHDPEGRSMPPPPSSRVKEMQLVRKPLQVKMDDFRPYKPEAEHKKVPFPERTLDGLLCVHVICGHGLKSSRTMLRDLYCVIEVDSVNKARTMIRTGAINFDWDESFDVDLEGAKEVSFLVYSWDPNTRHRLCFSGLVVLQAFIQYGSHQKVALKLEPKGILYLDIYYKEPSVSLQRAPSIRKNALFGTDLEVVVKREKTGSNVPIIVSRCIDEVERRGLDHVGIYRLCGSARRKSQLKEEFERNPKTVDLSSDSVSDINVITGVLKDFLRELPEPLFTNALYQMLLDALSVRLPGDPDGSAKLMLSILECLPKPNQETLATLLDHLKRVSMKSDVNKMTSQNLAVVFGPVLLCPSPVNVDVDGSVDFKRHIDVLHYLLEIWPEIREQTLGSQAGGEHDSDTSSSTKKGAPSGDSSNQTEEASQAAWEDNDHVSPC